MRLIKINDNIIIMILTRLNKTINVICILHQITLNDFEIVCALSIFDKVIEHLQI